MFNFFCLYKLERREEVKIKKDGDKRKIERKKQ